MLARFGLIGCGRIAPRHAQSLQQLPQTQLAAVADIRSDRARRISPQNTALMPMSITTNCWHARTSTL